MANIRQGYDVDTVLWHLFIQYLASRNVLDRWLDNVNEHESSHLSHLSYLCGFLPFNQDSSTYPTGFNWCSSSEGYTFWTKVMDGLPEWDRNYIELKLREMVEC